MLSTLTGSRKKRPERTTRDRLHPQSLQLIDSWSAALTLTHLGWVGLRFKRGRQRECILSEMNSLCVMLKSQRLAVSMVITSNWTLTLCTNKCLYSHDQRLPFKEILLVGRTYTKQTHTFHFSVSLRLAPCSMFTSHHSLSHTLLWQASIQQLAKNEALKQTVPQVYSTL